MPSTFRAVSGSASHAAAMVRTLCSICPGGAVIRVGQRRAVPRGAWARPIATTCSAVSSGLENECPHRPLRIWNLLIVAFARNGTVIPHGEFLIEPDFHRLAVFIGVALLKRIVT